MASTIVYKGVRRGTPGVYPTVNAGALTPVPGAASAGVAIVGSALSGIPVTDAMTVDEFYDAFYCSSPSAEVGPNRKYVSGDLFEAANALKRAGKAPSPLFLVKVGDDGYASTTVSGTYGTAFSLTAVEAGSRGNMNSFEMIAGTTDANTAHITYTDSKGTVYERDNIGTGPVFTALYTETPANNGWDTMKAYFGASGFVAHGSRTETNLLNSATHGTAGPATIAYTTGDNAGKVITIYGLGTGGIAQFEKVTIPATGSSIVTQKSWTEIYSAEASAAIATSDVTITSANPTLMITFAFATSDQYKFLVHAASMWVEPGTMLSYVASAASNVLLMFGKDANGADQIEKIQLAGTTPVIGTSSWSQITAIILGDVASGTVTIYGTAAAAPASRTLTELETALNAKTGFSADVTDSRRAQLALEDMDFTISASITTERSFYNVLYAVQDYADNVLAASATFERIAWVPKVSTITWASSAAGTFVLEGVTFTDIADAPAAKLAIDKYGASDVRFRVSTSSSGSGAASVLTITATQPDGFTLTESDGDISTAVVSSTAGQQSIVGATFTPERYFTGGTDATTTVANYTTALEKLRDFELNSIVVLSGDDAVHAALAEHLDYMEGLGGSERQGFVGLLNAALDDVPTKTEIRTQIRALNNRNITASVQAASWLDAAGTLTEYLPTMVAVLKAGAEIGQPLGVPITHKTLGSGGTVNLVSYVRQDSSWNPRADSDELIELGATILETTPQGKVRVVRHITTWLEDDNLAYANASVNRVVNFMVRDIRGTADAFVGTAGVRRTVQAVCDKIDDRLKMRLREELITSFSPTTGTLSGDVLTLRIEFAPTVDINFIVPNITLSASNIT